MVMTLGCTGPLGGSALLKVPETTKFIIGFNDGKHAVSRVSTRVTACW